MTEPLSHSAAIDAQICASDVVGVHTCEETHCGRDLLGLADEL